MNEERERLTLLVLPAHKQVLDILARDEDVSQAAIVRRLIRDEAKKRGLWPAAAATPSAADRVRGAVGP
jgi:hypothetical protein